MNGGEEWRIWDDPPGEPEENMVRDERLAGEVIAGDLPPGLRLYGWTRPAISVGRRQRVETLPASFVGESVPVVRRPTGGGAVVHRLEELTYALALPDRAVPNGLRRAQLPERVHRLFLEEILLRKLLPAGDLCLALGDPRPASTAICFSAPVRGDLLFLGKKVAGSALRAWKGGLLMQGSIQGLPLEQRMLKEMLAAALGRLAPIRRTR